ncbi:GIY-YIG nuclease family protein [Tardiphaga sp. 813_E8_N1_3]|uniref:GIY-YIG nuclease family protein n=1 Tax=Tardiphaga sp. 813_E8_N1_3 TaxID=3240760 RepID=UPI003F217BAA
MNVIDIHPAAEHSAPFELYALNRLADCSGCYCLTNAAGDILYAGQAISVQQRLIQHFNSAKKEALTNYGRVSRAWWRAEPTVSLNALERGWLESIRLRDGSLPPLNRAGGPI